MSENFELIEERGGRGKRAAVVSVKSQRGSQRNAGFGSVDYAPRTANASGWFYSDKALE